MALTRPFPVDSGFPTGLDLRRELGALVPFEGIFADPTTIAPAGIAYANGGWAVGALPFVAATRRGTAAFSQSYGTALLANDSSGTAWTIPAAPVSGSRIDILWIRATDPGQGEAATTTDGPGGAARAVPIFGQTNGVAATTPAAPALPAGAVEIARITTPSGAASITGSTFSHTYAFTSLAGGVQYFRTDAALKAWTTNVLEGQRARAIDTDVTYEWSGTAWLPTAPNATGGMAVIGTTQTYTNPTAATAFPGGADAVSATFSKRAASTRLRVRIVATAQLSAGVAQNVSAWIRVNGADYLVALRHFNQAPDRQTISGEAFLTGVAAFTGGTVQPGFRTAAGASLQQFVSDDYISWSIEEVA
jgi:hypothetical protein